MTEKGIVTSTVERNYILTLLERGKRLDGRGLSDYRPIKIKTGIVEKAEGSALVELGNTKVVAGVKLSIGKPYDDYPNKATLIVTGELNPTASPAFRNGPPSPESIELTRVTDRIIRESECVDLEDLCIIEGEKVWTIFLDIYPLDHDGNLFDACAIAAFAALSSTKVPEIKIDEMGEIEKLDTSRSIKLKEIPVSITTYKLGDFKITDPSYKEEDAGDARITIGFTEDHIVSAQKGGFGAFKSQELMDIFESSFKRSKELRSVIKSALNL